jgi:hypothetical protein
MDDSNGTMELPGTSSPNSRRVTINTDTNTLDDTALLPPQEEEETEGWAECLRGLGERCLSVLRLETVRWAVESRGYTVIMGLAAAISIFGECSYLKLHQMNAFFGHFPQTQ